MSDRTWHNLGDGSWWRPHNNDVDAWHALRRYNGWELRLALGCADGPPFLSRCDTLAIWRTLRSCRLDAIAYEEQAS